MRGPDLNPYSKSFYESTFFLLAVYYVKTGSSFLGLGTGWIQIKDLLLKKLKKTNRQGVLKCFYFGDCKVVLMWEEETKLDK